MVKYSEWCECKTEAVNGHDLNLLLVADENFETACESVAASVPSHYAFEERVVHILNKFGKEKAAAYLREKLPEQPKIRSGDLGEILATQFIDEFTKFNAPINRLRWKDHREMAMRGDDIIGIALNDSDNTIKFLKCEAKSRKSLTTSVVQQARQALNNCGGFPTPHSLAFISDRLYETDQDELADLITQAQLRDGISEEQMQHLTFTFSGNMPDSFLKVDLRVYSGSIPQKAIGLYLKKHQEFISTVYEKVRR